MTWYVVIFGGVPKYFGVRDNLRRVLDRIVEESHKKIGQHFAIFTDKRAAFVSYLKISKLKKIINAINRGKSCRDLAPTYCDFVGDYYPFTDVFYICRPSEGSMFVYRKERTVELWEFPRFRQTKVSCKTLEEIFNLDDFYRVLRKIKEEKKR